MKLPISSDDLIFTTCMDNSAITLHRLPRYAKIYPELKDPSIVALPNNTYFMFASIGRSDIQRWIVGRFVALHPSGPWIELPPVKFIDIEGPQLCAPAVMYEELQGIPRWTMYIQTCCFGEDGVILEAISEDGQTFFSTGEAVATRRTIDSAYNNVVGVYDAGTSEVKIGDQDYNCLLFSGYRRVGCGDLYMSMKPRSSYENTWTQAVKILAQEDVPFHNHPNSENFEWGLEGAKVIQASNNCFLLIGVCFLKEGKLGTRQRVFFAASESINGPYIPLGIPFTPQKNPHSGGEHGHPDTLVINNDLWIIYQERFGDGHPWHLRSSRFNLEDLKKKAEEELKKPTRERQSEKSISPVFVV